MKAVKYLVYVLGALIGLAIVVAIAVAVLFDPNQLKGEIERVVKEQTGRTLKLEGDLRLAFWPSIGASMGRASLSERASAKTFASLESAQLAVRLLPLLRGETIVDEVRLSGLKVNLEKGRDGKFNFDDLLAAGGERPAGRPQARASGHGSPVRFDVSGVRVENAGATYRDLKSGQTVVVSDLSLRTGRIASKVPGKLDFAAAVKSDKPALDAKVELSTGYRFDASRRVIALDGLASKLTLSGPEIPNKTLTIPLTGSAQVDLGKPSAHADLAAKLDESSIRAKLALEGAAPPSYNFDLEIDRLNLDRYFPPEDGTRGGTAAASGARGGASAADTPVDLSALKGLRARGRLRIGQLQVQRVKLAQVATDVRVADGRAELAPHSASLYQGALAGALTLDANARRVALKEKLTGVSIGPLVADLAQRDIVAGRGDVALDVGATGSSVKAMKKSLAGSARLALRDAAIKGVNLGESLRKAQSLISSKSTQTMSADRAQQTDFSEMSASFAIRNGVAHNDDLSAKAPLFRLTGAGDIDIGSERIDYRAKAAVVGSAEGQGGKELAQLRGLSVPVRIVGPFDALKFEIDYKAVAAEMAKSRVKQKLEERLGVKPGQGGDLKEKLRGLLRR
jgi:AsmA protein